MNNEKYCKLLNGLNDGKVNHLFAIPSLSGLTFTLFHQNLLVMPAVSNEKSRKHTTTNLYSKKPGPKGPRSQNQPASASKAIKQSSKRLTNHNWLVIFAWIDTKSKAR